MAITWLDKKENSMSKLTNNKFAFLGHIQFRGHRKRMGSEMGTKTMSFNHIKINL